MAYRYFSTNKRKFIIADTPGHEQYTRNMVTGASTANLAVILIDARKGVITQTKRHSYLVSLLGIKHVALAVNKMDLVDYSQEVFDKICKTYKDFVARLNIPDVHYFPLSALKGDNVVDRSDKMAWYKGKSLLQFLETVYVSSDRNFEEMRYPVQYVNRPDIHFRGFASTVASGILKKGEEIMVLPSRQTSRIKEVITDDGVLEEAFPPQSVTITLEDEIDASRGNMIIYPHQQPHVGQHIDAMLVWMDEEPMNAQTHFFLKHAYNNCRAHVHTIDYKVDVNTLERSQPEELVLNDIARVQVTTTTPLFFDPYKQNRQTGSFILIDPLTHHTAAVGMMIGKSKNAGHYVQAEGEVYAIEGAAQCQTKREALLQQGRMAVVIEKRFVDEQLHGDDREATINAFVDLMRRSGVDVIVER
ncbi:MAG: sulfate adenylyltransferase subunit CysN [Bacteroidetes bacterium]|nr:MAG: sulfate adenylyltransferase subunit CysN [Bacteroidota bacterium]